MEEKKTVLEFRNITKEYPGTTALDNVSLVLKEGEVHAIVGENGAGKSTLIKTCSGVVTPTSGTVVVNGKEFKGLTALESKENGISVIYQELNLVGSLSVFENVYLGNMILKGNGITPDNRKMKENTQKIIDQFHVDISAGQLVENLSIGKQQMVEIVKSISRKTKILIMDEPTAPLTDQEVEILMNIIRQLRTQGVAVIYISHRLEEIFQIADRVTVLRDGKYIGTKNVAETNRQELIKMMVGRDIIDAYPKRSGISPDEVILSVRHLSGNGDTDISFDVHRGEVVGIAGLIGSGRTELAQLLFGYKPVESGSIEYKGKSVKIRSIHDAVNRGIAYTPEDRKKMGLVMDFSIKNNISMAILERISHLGFIRKQEEREIANELKQEVGIKAPDIKTPAGSLSGGNQQKVVLCRWLAAKPDVFILDEPTRGIDVGAKYEIYMMINDLVAAGMAVIMISSEMGEILGMSDRIIVLSEGRMTADLKNENLDQETILHYASI